MFFHDDYGGNERELVAERRKRKHQNEYIDKPSRLLVLGDEPVSNRPKLLRSESARPIFNHCMDCSLSSHSICLNFVHRFSRSCIQSCLNPCIFHVRIHTDYLIFGLLSVNVVYGFTNI